jgi:DNA-binding NtrC family response regulator
MDLHLNKSITMELSGRSRTPESPRMLGSLPPRSSSRASGDGSKRQSSAPPSPRKQARFGELEAASKVMREVFGTLARLAPTEISVMLTGETGTGKSLLARAIHDASARAGGPFVALECGATASNLVEIELFGRERGAGPEAYSGALESARGGTLFLDEICDLPRELQARLLRALESSSVRRAGSTDARPIDVRIVASCRRDLKQRVQEGAFRDDLYFRLASTIVAVPPLRERMEDLPVIVERLLAKLGRDETQLTPEALELLRSRSWPGNVRQLENVLAAALAFVDAELLEAQHLRAASPDGGDPSIDALPLGGLTLEDIERVAIKQTLALTGGMKVRAAELLGIAVSTLYQKLKKYGL